MAANSGLATAGLLAAGKKICWAASWVWTSLPMKLWPHSASPPATARVTARNRPATAIRRSNVLRFMRNLQELKLAQIRGGGARPAGAGARKRLPMCGAVDRCQHRAGEARRGRAGGGGLAGKEGAEFGHGGHQRGGQHSDNYHDDNQAV